MEKLEAIAEELEEDGFSTPFEDRPELYPDLVEVYQAFLQLSRSRPVGFSVGTIPASQIEAWLNIHQVTDLQERADFFVYINAMDSTWLEWYRNEQEAQKENDTDGNS